jgi:signal transduction histidine kinase
VADGGGGIPADRRDAVLGRGNKGESSSGTGFGLFFVSSMVESYGGTVDIGESDTGGACFTVSVPLADTSP